MKKIFIIITITGLFATNSFAQNVGIGITTPAAPLHVANSSVLFSAADNVTDVPGSLIFPDTTRVMLWRASKAAFRNGYMDSSCLYPNYMGAYSFANGYLSKATGVCAVSLGYLSVASGEVSAAFGTSTQATGDNSMAFGNKSRALSTASFASGYNCLAYEYATAMGYAATASAYSSAFGGSAKANHNYTTALGISQVGQQYSTGMGKYTTVFGNALTSTAMGEATTTNGWYSVSMGYDTWSPSFACLTLGRWNTRYNTSSTSAWVGADPVLLVGGGTDNTTAAAANIFTLLKNGNLTISGTLSQFSDERLKKDITPLSNCLEKINELAGYNYNWKSELADAKMQSGVLAQEVEKLMPELVAQTTNGDKGVNYSALIPYLIEAIKELHKQIIEADALQAEYNILKTRHDEMVKRVELIERKSKMQPALQPSGAFQIVAVNL